MIKERVFKVTVKAGSESTEIVGFDEARNAYIIRVKAPAEKDKANKELIKFLSKELKKRVSIISGLRSREKLIKAE